MSLIKEIVGTFLCCLVGIGVVTLGYRSEARARNSDNNYSEECHNEGCDNEELREMYVNGSYKEEVYYEFTQKGAKTLQDAGYEMMELTLPGWRSWDPSWWQEYDQICVDMLRDFRDRLNRSVDPRFFSGYAHCIR